jgi:uncharacterized membrane protein
MALLIFPIAVALGWLIRSPIRAAAVTAAVGLGALVVLVCLWVAGTEVSPLETIVLAIGTPLSAALAHAVAKWRDARRSTPVQS